MRYALLGFCLLTACGEKVLYLGEPGRSAVGVEPPLQLLWTHKMDGSPLGGALFAGDLILQLTTEATLYALNQRNGTQLGKHGYDKMACAPGQLAGALYALGCWAASLACGFWIGGQQRSFGSTRVCFVRCRSCAAIP